jgi:hypothetical protein
MLMCFELGFLQFVSDFFEICVHVYTCMILLVSRVLGVDLVVHDKNVVCD